jgi:hypothetical protein
LFSEFEQKNVIKLLPRVALFFYVGQTIVKTRFGFVLAFRKLIVDSDVFKLNIFLVSDLFQKLFLEHFFAELNFDF